jgi:hypothetical protein
MIFSQSITGNKKLQMEFVSESNGGTKQEAAAVEIVP